MSLLDIRLYGDPVLRQKADPVGEIDDDLRTLAADMIETMYAAPGRGLAAPQVGVSKRLFVMDCGWKDGAPRDPMAFVDPEILGVSAETETREEGCLSIPGVLVPVTRPAAVTIAWTGLDGARQSRAFDGFAAACIQHEVDHLDGILTVDRLPEDARGEIAQTLGRLAAKTA